MKVYAKLNMGINYKYVTEDEMAYAQKVYDRYVGFLKKHYGRYYGTNKDHTAVSLAEFLLQDVDYYHMDSFAMDKGVLVVRQAKLGRANRMKGVCTAKKTKCR